MLFSSPGGSQNAWAARSEERITAQEAMNSRHFDRERRAASSRSWKKATLFQAAFPTSETARSRVMGRCSPAALAALSAAAPSTKMAQITPELVKLNPQGTVHAKSVYSAVNVVRRTPPGPVFHALISNRRFRDVGNGLFALS